MLARELVTKSWNVLARNKHIQSTMIAFLLAFWIAVAALVQADYWLGSIPHQGASAFNPDKSYKVFRNVRDFGARGGLAHHLNFHPY
ncbi:hypothetical protein BC830DRAFT_1168476 [Chytriomyces sp. MP71]|nr:hypothetical protein BC830DRAFT_1168476 [Chytriomyces sp. MP71]